MEELVIARDVRQSFGAAEALRGVSFDLRAGESLGLLGPAGAGKSSLTGLLAGRTPLQGGQLKILGMDARTHGRALRGLVGWVPAGDTLDDELTALDNLWVFGRYHGLPRREARRRAGELLGFAGLAERSAALPGELGADGRRRLQLARALIQRPGLLVLDEPAAGLEPAAQRFVWGRLLALRAQGLPMLLATPNPDEACLLCGRLLLLEHGRVLDEGGPAELVARHAGGEVVELRPLDGLPREDLDSFLAESVPAGARLERREGAVLCFSPAGEMFPGALLERAHQRGFAVTTRRASLADALRALRGREVRT
jgi:lipooligosaccharide transport system ATP-binding protein